MQSRTSNEAEAHSSSTKGSGTIVLAVMIAAVGGALAVLLISLTRNAATHGLNIVQMHGSLAEERVVAVQRCTDAT